ncbi:hypothetical protein CHU98_g347 [Xylaria longipes]|nr:hypothetical protein CHU98_g347 [Xylaria longipes]
MAPTEFIHYPRLPNELKAMVWEYAFAEWSSGAHRFQLVICRESRTKLVMRPDKVQKDDASAWRERLALAKTDYCSADVFRRIQCKAEGRNQLKLLCKDRSYIRRRWVEDGFAAKIHLETDLVTFRFNYGLSDASLALLSPVDNKDLFTGITQVGIEVDLIKTGYFKRNQKTRPFRCLCRHPAHHYYHCHIEVAKFLQYFKDLKVVYIIFTLTSAHKKRISTFLSSHATVPSRLRAHGHRVNQLNLDAFQALQDIAQKEGLEQFHDRNGTYCEIPTGVGLYSLFNQCVDEFYEKWESFHLTQQSAKDDWESIEFKTLLRTDLRDATVTGGEQLLQRVGPW